MNRRARRESKPGREFLAARGLGRRPTRGVVRCDAGHSATSAWNCCCFFLFFSFFFFFTLPHGFSSLSLTCLYRSPTYIVRIELWSARLAADPCKTTSCDLPIVHGHGQLLAVDAPLDVVLQ